MTVKELSDKLKYLNQDDVIIFMDEDGGWTNIDINMHDNNSSCVQIVPSSNTIFTDDKC